MTSKPKLRFRSAFSDADRVLSSIPIISFFDWSLDNTFSRLAGALPTFIVNLISFESLITFAFTFFPGLILPTVCGRSAE